MKKLLDENTDELTRALLEAGRAHRPPATNQAKLLLALGVGSGVGLLSSKAFAWLGSTSGKLSVLGVGVVGVGVAGALYAGVPSSADASADRVAQSEARSSAVTSSAVTSSAVTSSAVTSSAVTSSAVPAHAQAGARVAAPPPAELSQFVPAHVADAPSRPGRDPVAGLPAVNEGPARRENAPAASESPHRTARVRKGSAVRRDDVHERRAARHARAPVAAPPQPVAALAEADTPAAPGLESELQLVDAMRGAAQRNDTRALRGLLESYRGSFPDGQLRAEVAELALRALPDAR
jgi:hypothetical protein